MKCQTVLIKFMERGSPQQEVTTTHVTGGKHITVDYDQHFLKLTHMNAKDLPLKTISYNLNDVKEFVCEGVLWESTK